MCESRKRRYWDIIAYKSYSHRFINKATYGRKVEDIYEYTLDSKQWMSPMIFHLWYSRLTDLFLLGCITTSSQHFNFNCDLYSARDYQHCWADVSGGSVCLRWSQVTACFLCRDLSPNISRVSVMLIMWWMVIKITGNCFLLSTSWELISIVGFELDSSVESRKMLTLLHKVRWNKSFNPPVTSHHTPCNRM